MQANDLNRLFRSLKQNENQTDGDVQRAVQGLSGAQKAKLDEILSSPEKMKALLGSDAAGKLLEKLGKQGT